MGGGSKPVQGAPYRARTPRVLNLSRASGRDRDWSGTLWARREVCSECTWGWGVGAEMVSSFLGEVTPEKARGVASGRSQDPSLCEHTILRFAGLVNLPMQFPQN